jgi:hypothetical protein
LKKILLLRTGVSSDLPAAAGLDESIRSTGPYFLSGDLLR